MLRGRKRPNLLFHEPPFHEPPMKRTISMAAVMALGLVPSTALAHDARPLSVVVQEKATHVYSVGILVPPSVDLTNQPKVEWPDGCQMQGETTSTSLEATMQRGLVSCQASLENQLIKIHYELFNPSLSTYVRVTLLNGPVRTALLPPQQMTWRVPATPGRWEVARQYMRLGITHIWTGVDHLLFVTGLLLLAGTGRRIFWAITGFSVSHSISLTLSALGYVHIPVPPTEAAIALSILFLACEILRGRQDTLAWRYPLLVSTSFGLLHGLGFAAALGEVGLPPLEIPTALFFFSVGVETGQMIFILPIIGGILWVARKRSENLLPAWLDFSATATSAVVPWAIGLAASFWFVQRLAAFAR
jgi:hydrogenase/urease accessory protein HupE